MRPKLTETQTAAIKAFAAQQGRQWRMVLADMWKSRWGLGIPNTKPGAGTGAACWGKGELTGLGGYYGTATDARALDSLYLDLHIDINEGDYATRPQRFMTTCLTFLRRIPIVGATHDEQWQSIYPGANYRSEAAPVLKLGSTMRSIPLREEDREEPDCLNPRPRCDPEAGVGPLA